MLNDVRFEKVIPNEGQIETLYALLLQREHGISHKKDVTLDDHNSFVRKKPYRAWYIVRIGEEAVGSFYVGRNNMVGINVQKQESVELVSRVLSYVSDNYRPLKAIPSDRSEVFGINVAPTNKFLLDALKELNAEVAQITFYLPR